MIKKIHFSILTMKYFIQGDGWHQAKNYARVIVYGWDRQGRRVKL